MENETPKPAGRTYFKVVRLNTPIPNIMADSWEPVNVFTAVPGTTIHLHTSGQWVVITRAATDSKIWVPMSAVQSAIEADVVPVPVAAVPVFVPPPAPVSTPAQTKATPAEPFVRRQAKKPGAT